MRRPQDAFNITFEPIVEEDREEAELIEAMMKNNKVHLLYDAMGKEVPGQHPLPKKERAKSVTRGDDGGGKTIHSLFEYTRSEFLDKMRLDYEEIYETFAERARPLLTELQEDKALIMEIVDTFITRMVLNLITQDKVAVKVRTDMVDRVEALYDHRDGKAVMRVKNDFVNYDYVNECLSRRCKEARNEATDELYARFSEPKKRGRHPKTKTEEVINEIESIAGEYIAKRLTLIQQQQQPGTTTVAAAATTNSGDDSGASSPVNNSSGGSSDESGGGGGGTNNINLTQKASSIDYYPVCQQVFETYNRCTPKLNNHGFYLQRLMHFIRVLDSRVWPLHGLMSIANNMNYCVHAETVKMHFDRSKKRFYCCYSGLEIKNGETVTYLRVVENDAARLKEWRDNPILMGKPFESPEFTRSIGAFYLKKELCCPSTLFYTPFTESYKAQFPDYFNPAPTTTTKSATKSTKAAATKKRVIKPKRKALEALPPVADEPVTKKARLEMPSSRIVLTNIRCEDDNLFESLSVTVTAAEAPTLPNLRRCMGALLHGVEVDKVWYGCAGQAESLLTVARYTKERRAIRDLLAEVTTKKAFPTVIREIVARTIVDDTVGVEHCYALLLDFTEAVIVPEKRLSSFALRQTDTVMRTLLHETRHRIRERTSPSLVTSTTVTSVDEMVHSPWFQTCPLLFMLLFGYMVECDQDGLLKKK